MKSLAVALGIFSSVAAYSKTQQTLLSTPEVPEIVKYPEEEGGGFSMRLTPKYRERTYREQMSYLKKKRKHKAHKA